MKKIRKGQKKILILLIAIIIAVIAIVLIVKNINKKPTPGTGIEYEPIIQLPDTTYSEMQVKNIQVKFLKDNDDGKGETVLSMEIHNTTTKKVEDEHFTAVLIGPNEEILGQMPAWISELDVGKEFRTEVVLDGDLTAVKQIKLIEK